jgi:hypothetical protein
LRHPRSVYAYATERPQVHAGRFADVHGNRSYVNISVAVDPETPENGPLYNRGPRSHSVPASAGTAAQSCSTKHTTISLIEHVPMEVGT